MDPDSRSGYLDISGRWYEHISSHHNKVKPRTHFNFKMELENAKSQSRTRVVIPTSHLNLASQWVEAIEYTVGII